MEEEPLQLEGDSFQGVTRTPQHPLTGCGGTGEADLVKAWVAGHPWTQTVVAAQRLHHSRREERLGQLHKLEPPIRGERPVEQKRQRQQPRSRPVIPRKSELTRVSL